MAWKNVLYALLAVILPIAFGWLLGLVPSFPLGSEEFVALVLWIVGLLVGGWQSAKANYTFAGRLLAKESPGVYKAKMSFDEGTPFDWKYVIYALLGVTLPLLYTWFFGSLNDFPLDMETFVALVLWLIGLAVGGWQGSKAYYIASKRLLDSTRTMRL